MIWQAVGEMQNLFCYFDLCSAMMGSYGPALQTVGIVIFVLVFNFLVKYVLLKLRTRFNSSGNIWAWSFVAALPKPLKYFVWFTAAVCSIDNIAFSLFGFHLLKISTILLIGGIVCFCWFLLRWNRKLMHAMIEKSQSHQIPFDPGKIDLIGKLVTIGIILLTLFMLLDLTGHNMQTLIAFGGIGGLAIAFASQQIISSFFGGILIYMTRPFTIGEKVELPSQKIEGYIEEIGWYTTCIRDLEKSPVYLPNSIFTQSVVITPSRMTHEHFQYTFSLRQEDIQRVPSVVEAIKKMLLHHPQVDHYSQIEVFMKGFSSSGLEIEASAFIPVLYKGDFKMIRQDLLLKIYSLIETEKAALASNNYPVEFKNSPFPN